MPGRQPTPLNVFTDALEQHHELSRHLNTLLDLQSDLFREKNICIRVNLERFKIFEIILKRSLFFLLYRQRKTTLILNMI